MSDSRIRLLDMTSKRRGSETALSKDGGLELGFGAFSIPLTLRKNWSRSSLSSKRRMDLGASQALRVYQHQYVVSRAKS